MKFYKIYCRTCNKYVDLKTIPTNKQVCCKCEGTDFYFYDEDEIRKEDLKEDLKDILRNDNGTFAEIIEDIIEENSYGRL